MKGTVSVGVGPSGGVYFRRSPVLVRLCLWRVAITWVRGVEVDELLNVYGKAIPIAYQWAQHRCMSVPEPLRGLLDHLSAREARP